MEKTVGIDIGACIGETLYQFDDLDVVYAIEPAGQEFQILKEKFIDDKRIIPVQYAISDKSGESMLNCYYNGRFSSMLDFNRQGKFYDFLNNYEGIDGFDELREVEKVKTIRLDEFIEKYDLTNIDFIKTDTQGYDLKVVKSLGKYIKNVKKIQMEIQLQELYKDSPKKKEVVDYMEKNGFKIVDTTYGESSKEYEQDLIFERV